jgi:hypothetical protein
LRAAKLGALVRDHFEKEATSRRLPSDLPGGAALLEPEARRAWVLIDDGVVSRFGPALAWGWRQVVEDLHVLVEARAPGGSPAASGVIARRAAAMANPPRVWDVRGRDLVAASPAEIVAPDDASPEGAPAEIVAPDDVSPEGAPPDGSRQSVLSEAGSPAGVFREAATPAAAAAGRASSRQLEAYCDLLRVHGAEPIFEHGVLRGELLGLEVARVIAGQLEVGVGRHDRLARAEMHPDEDIGHALDEAVAAVRARRRLGEPRHPANTLARGRWLRSIVCTRPGLVGARDLAPVAPPLPWFDLPEAGAAPAVGTSSAGGGPLVVVCSVGVDMDLVPTAADSRLIHRPDAELAIVVPEGDDVPVTRALAGMLADQADVRVVPRGWEDL